MAGAAVLKAQGARFRDEYAILSGEKIVGALFGSRRGEVRRTGPVLRDAIFRLADKMGQLPHIVAPTLPHIQDDVLALLRDYQGPIHVFTEQDHKWDAFKAFDVAMATSGTVGLELAMLEVPHIIGYRMNTLTYHIVRRMIKVKYAHLANIMANAEIVPEFLQNDCLAEPIAEKAFELLNNPGVQKAALADVRFRIGAGQEKTPSQKASAFVLSYLEK